MIEARTYRYREHSEALERILREEYRKDEEVAEWEERDPIDLFRVLLVDEGIATEAEIDKLQSEIHDAVEEALEFARESPYPEPDELFEDMYADPITV